MWEVISWRSIPAAAQSKANIFSLVPWWMLEKAFQRNGQNWRKCVFYGCGARWPSFLLLFLCLSQFREEGKCSWEQPLVIWKTDWAGYLQIHLPKNKFDNWRKLAWRWKRHLQLEGHELSRVLTICGKCRKVTFWQDTLATGKPINFNLSLSESPPFDFGTFLKETKIAVL